MKSSPRKRKLARTAKLPAKVAIIALRILAYPFQLAGKGVFLLGMGLVEYCRSRQTKPLLWGLPALLVLASSAYLVTASQSSTQSQLAQKYKKAAQAAVTSSQWQLAVLLLERCIELGSRDKEVLFDLAVASEKTGNEDRKRLVLEALAPESFASHAKAHLWKAMSILNAGNVSTEQARNAELHLKHTLSLEPENQIAHAYLGELYFALDLMPAAIEHLRQTDRTNTGFRLKLAKALLRTGDKLTAESVAEEIVRSLKDEVLNDPQNVQIWLDLAEAHTLLGQFEAASRILQDALVLHDQPKLRDALSMTWILWSDQLVTAEPPNYEGAFELLAGGFVNTPNESLLFDRMLKVLKSKSDATTEAEEFLTQNIVKGVAPGLSHLILGTYLFEVNRPEEAGIHLDQAFKLLPNGPIVANNLAWYLVRTEPGDPERALKIIELVISNFPHDVEYQDTRGHILIHLGKFQEGIRDLEKSLTTLGSRKSTHEGLAKAYEGLGLNDLAARHQEIATRPREYTEHTNTPQ